MAYSQTNKYDFFLSGKFMNLSMMGYYRFDFFQLVVVTCFVYDVCHMLKTYLLIKGLKLFKII